MKLLLKTGRKNFSLAFIYRGAFIILIMTACQVSHTSAKQTFKHGHLCPFRNIAMFKYVISESINFKMFCCNVNFC